MLIAATAAVGTVVVVAGCMAPHLTKPRQDGDTFAEWQERMGLVLRADDLAGAGGGDTRSTLTIGPVPAGSYDVLIVCTGVPFVHMRITAADDSTVAESDIPCGATARFPVELHGTTTVSDKPADDRTVEFDATRTHGGTGWWSAAIDPVGWQPSGTSSFG
jgi:hypothetical protein